MIERIVKMTFREEALADFRDVFARVKEDIRRFPGCRSLKLMQANQNKNVLFTLSIWDSEEALDNYRSSPFFAETWKATKALFAAKAEAWSVHLIDEPDLAKF